MERLLIECFSEEEDINVTNPVALLNAAQNCSPDIPIFWSPKPYDPEQGWERNDEGVLEPVWSSGPVLPPTMIDLVEKTTEEMEQCDDDIEEEQSEQDSDYEELLIKPFVFVLKTAYTCTLSFKKSRTQNIRSLRCRVENKEDGMKFDLVAL
ncbi:hypothetical protein GQR58_010461 [Nymphon striatum]|nr:hypothetical protein GQR58_010461 [Nymphon striatum]